MSNILPDLGEDHTPNELEATRRLEARFLESEENIFPDSITDENGYVQKEALEPLPTPPKSIALPRLEEVSIYAGGFRMKISVVAVSVTDSGVGLLLPRHQTFEPDMGLEFELSYRGKVYKLVSASQVHKFPSLDYTFASFMLVQDDD